MTPKQRMLFNGTYLENLVTGYQTLEVTGREDTDNAITTIKLDTVNGERYRSQRMEKRTIKVRYMIRRDTPANFLLSYRQLNAALSVSEVRLIFDDEPDVYFVGTPESLSVDYPGQSVSTGTIEIYCSDPYKYKLTETEVTATTVDDVTAAEITYNGTHPAFPNFEITANSNLGFIGISDEEGHVIQIGDPLDVDQEGTWEEEKSVVDITSTPPTTNDWTLNDAGFTLLGTRTKMGNVTTSQETVRGKQAATPSYGSQSSGWHGPSLSYVLSGDGSTQASLEWQQLFYDGTTKKTALGLFAAQMNDANGVCIGGVIMYHSSTGSANSYINLYINGVKGKSITFKATKDNVFTGTKGGTCSLSKFGDTITYKIGTKTYTLTDTAIENVAVKQCGFFFGRTGTKPVMTRNVLYKADVISHRVFSYQNVPNKIQAGDVILVDVGSGTINLNGVPVEGLGALGNDYETFTLTPGANVIGFVCSDWAASAPTYKVKYQEVYV